MTLGDMVAALNEARAERDRYRAEWEEAARHALRWQAEYDTAQQEIERLRAEVDTCTGCGSSLLACLRWVNDLDPAHLKCCPDCRHPQEHLVWLDLRESRDEARAEVERLRASSEDCVNGTLHARAERAEHALSLASSGDVALAAIVARGGERVAELTAERDEALAAIARLESRVRELEAGDAR